jgi:hypothetical protein
VIKLYTRQCVSMFPVVVLSCQYSIVLQKHDLVDVSGEDGVVHSLATRGPALLCYTAIWWVEQQLTCVYCDNHFLN